MTEPIRTGGGRERSIDGEEGMQTVETICVPIDERHLSEAKRLQALINDYNQKGWAVKTPPLGSSLLFERPIMSAVASRQGVGTMSAGRDA